MFFKNTYNKNFMLYLLGHNSSIFGDIILLTGVAFHIMKLTGSTMQFSVTIAISFVPRILFSPYAGVIVDRLNKKKLVIILDLLRATWLLALWIYAQNTTLSLSIIYITLFFFALCDCFFGPAFSTIYPKIVDKAFYSKGNAISNTLTSITNTVSPLVASIIYVNYGLSLLLIFDAITFFISAISELYLIFDEEISANTRKITQEFMEGIELVKENTRLKSLLLNGNLTHLFLFPFIEVGVVYLLFIMFKTPDLHYGIVRSCISGGAILSGVVAIHYQKSRSIAANINTGILWMMAAVATFMLLLFDAFCDILIRIDLLPVIYLSTACFIMFFAFGFYGVFFRSFYQTEVPNNLLGRYISLMIMTFSASRLIGMLVYGYLFEIGLLNLALFILATGMSLKLLAHIPFLRYERNLLNEEQRGNNNGAESSIR